MDLRHPDAGGQAELAETSSCGVPVHPVTTSATEQRPVVSAVDGAVSDAGRSLAAAGREPLAALPRTAAPVPELFAQVFDVGPGGLEDPRTEEPE